MVVDANFLMFNQLHKYIVYILVSVVWVPLL